MPTNQLFSNQLRNIKDVRTLFFEAAGNQVPPSSVWQKLAALGGDVLGFARNDVAQLSKPRLAPLQTTPGNIYATKGGMLLRATSGRLMMWLRQYACVSV